MKGAVAKVDAEPAEVVEVAESAVGFGVDAGTGAGDDAGAGLCAWYKAEPG